ncbi:MAG: hemerythrin domain-containing protein [Dehalococcoidia bacterium]
MNEVRVDLYAKVHKGQRQRLFELSTHAGRTDLMDDTEVAALGTQIEAMLAELDEHGEHEDRLIHPVLSEVARPVTEALDSEHEGLETAMRRLQTAFGALANALEPERRSAARELYLEINAFIATYLAHLDREEREAMPALWSGCDDPRLIGIMATFNAGRSAEQRVTDLMKMLPAINPQERAEVLGGIRAAGGPEGFAHALDAARETLAAADWKRLRTDLEG